MRYQEIIEKLPYTEPFLFVDELTHIDSNGAEGSYTFAATAEFYQGHFKGKPITPGVLLTECCAQIGLVALGIFLLHKDGVAIGEQLQIGLSSSDMEFYEPVLPDEKVVVRSEKIYYRFHKLKCKVNMYNSAERLVCKGIISGMLKSNVHG